MKNFFSSRLSRYMLASTAALALLLAGSQSCLANSITLTSSSNGVYDYGLTVTNLLDVFDKGQTISLSGLSGVTGASVAGVLAADGFKVSSFTSTSVVYAETLPVALLPGPFTWGSLVVDSLVNGDTRNNRFRHADRQQWHDFGHHARPCGHSSHDRGRQHTPVSGNYVGYPVGRKQIFGHAIRPCGVNNLCFTFSLIRLATWIYRT
jgi:hypothetical protein